MFHGHKIGNAAKTALSSLRRLRNPNEFYETPFVALDELETLLYKQEIRSLLPENSSILEPTDGNGRIGGFLREDMGFSVLSSDVMPRIAGVKKKDFFEYDDATQFSAVIFNPPFGAFKKNQKWLRHALKQARLVIALLPQRFQTNKEVFKKFTHKLLAIKATDYLAFPSDCSLEDGKADQLTMACHWYVWDRERNSDTAYYKFE